MVCKHYSLSEESFNNEDEAYLNTLNQNDEIPNEVYIPLFEISNTEETRDWTWFLWHCSPTDIDLKEMIHNPLELAVALEEYKADKLYNNGESYYFLANETDRPGNYNLTGEINFYQKSTLMPQKRTADWEIPQLGVEWKQLLRALILIVRDNPQYVNQLIGSRVEVTIELTDSGVVYNQTMTILMNQPDPVVVHEIKDYLIKKVIFPQDNDHPMTFEEY